jgi:hypothetical protein
MGVGTRWMSIIALGAMLSPAALASDPSSPHPHHGIIAKFVGKPALPPLTAADLSTLAEGKPVMKQVKNADGNGGRGVGIQDIHAEPATIWSRILSFSNYPQWVDGVKECQLYEQTATGNKVRFKIGKMGVNYEYFIKHEVHTDDGYITWTLDYDRLSDFDDSVGFWEAVPVEGKPGWTRVYYSVDVKLTGWVPGFVQDMITKSGLTSATAWVKRESEAKQAAGG